MVNPALPGHNTLTILETLCVMTHTFGVFFQNLPILNFWLFQFPQIKLSGKSEQLKFECIFEV